MGETKAIRFGYGVKLKKGGNYDDLVTFLPENYPLLEDGWAGWNRGHHGFEETWVFVKSTLVTSYCHKAELNSDNFIVSEEGLEEIGQFIKNSPWADGEAKWMVLSSVC